MTANVYTDPKLLEVFGVLDALPSLPLDTDSVQNQERARAIATGTYDDRAVALLVALPGDKRSETVVKADKMNTDAMATSNCDGFDATVEMETPSVALTIAGKDRSEWAMQGSNLRPHACRACALAN